MKRTKQWWAGLNKEERSELHHLEYANASWLQRKNKKILRCSYCNKFTEYEPSWLCPKCQNRRNHLIKKANKVILASQNN